MDFNDFERIKEEDLHMDFNDFEQINDIVQREVLRKTPAKNGVSTAYTQAIKDMNDSIDKCTHS